MNFKINKNGQLTDLAVSPISENKNEFLVKEAFRVISLTKNNWLAAKSKNIFIDSYHGQSISFVLPKPD